VRPAALNSQPGALKSRAARIRACRTPPAPRPLAGLWWRIPAALDLASTRGGTTELDEANDDAPLHTAENHVAAVAQNYFADNFIKVHTTLRMTSAMAAGVTSKLWDVPDRVDLLIEAESQKKPDR
jgi:hypothetical protein